jgi:hypothetical protein
LSCTTAAGGTALSMVNFFWSATAALKACSEATMVASCA